MSAIVHHLKGIADKAGYRFDRDCQVETQSEIEDLLRRLQTLEDKVAELESQLEQPDWRER